MERKQFKVLSKDEKELVNKLNEREDTDALRMKRYLSMPDLSRTPGSPISEIVTRITESPYFKDLDIIETPEIVPADISFDLFDFPMDHPARSKSDTYYVDDKNILRTHTTVCWYYYLMLEEIKKQIVENKPVGCFSFGKVYRKDEIDRNHMNVFHQIDGWYLIPKSIGVMGVKDLEETLGNVAKAVFGPDVVYKLDKDTFPYTNPSLEMSIKTGDRWVEGNGCGVVKGSVLEKLGVDSKNYTGWAFGFGLERLAIANIHLPDIRLLWSEDPRVKSQLKLGNKYKEVSKYPSVVRDISFIVDKSFVPNNYFDLIREVTGESMVEEVKLLDEYENEEKFGKDKKSYAFRIIYRSVEKTLTNAEVDEMHKKLEKKTAETLGATVR